MLHAQTLGILLILSQSSCGQTRFLGKRRLVGGQAAKSILVPCRNLACADGSFLKRDLIMLLFGFL